MPKITRQQVAGNQGEAMVAYRLSKYCLVRPVASGTDIGVDHYCETISEDQPNNHFMVQVKARAKFKKSIRLTRDEVQYWWRQPMPVFIFLVSSSSSFANGTSKIHVIDLVDYSINTPVLNKYTLMSSTFTIDSDESMEQFINQIVPHAAARQWLKFGVIMPIKPRVNFDYIMTYPRDSLHKYAKECIKQIGRTSALLLLDILVQPGDISSNQNQLEKILESFTNDGHYDFHYSLGLSKFDRGDLSGAIGPLERAITCIETDPKINQANWEPVKTKIRDTIKQIKERLEEH